MQVTERAHTAFEPDMRKQLRPDFGGAHGLDAPTVAGSQLVLRLSVQVQEVTLQALAGQFPAQALPPLPECIYFTYAFPLPGIRSLLIPT